MRNIKQVLNADFHLKEELYKSNNGPKSVAIKRFKQSMIYIKFQLFVSIKIIDYYIYQKVK